MHLEVARANGPAYAAVGGPQDLPSLTISAFRDLGLQLESSKFDVQIMVIDHIERTPEEN